MDEVTCACAVIPQKRTTDHGHLRAWIRSAKLTSGIIARASASMSSNQQPSTDSSTVRRRGIATTSLPILTVAAVLAAVLATYWPALSAGARYMDDKFYLGPLTQHPSWASLKTIFGQVFSPSMVNGYYQPLSLTSIMVDFLDPAASSGLQPFHRTTLILHLLNVALLVRLLYVLWGNWVTASLLGFIYGVHPVNADAVLWVAERKTVLSTCFALSSLLLYLAYVRHRNHANRGDWKRYGAALLMYVCAVLSKPTTVPVALLLPVLDYWPLGRLTRKTWLEKVPFFVVCVLAGLVTVISQSSAGDGGQTHFMKPQYVPLIVGYDLGFYLLKLVWPTRLVSDYSTPQPLSLANPEVLGSIIVVVGIAAAIAMSVRRSRAWLAGGLFFLIAIFPTLGIVRYTWSIAANRSLYLPMVGLLLALGWQSARCWEKGLFALTAALARLVLIAVGVALALGCAWATRNYESHWRDSVTLLRYYISQQPNEGTFHTRLGNEWIAQRDYPAAITEFTAAARLTPMWTENHLNLGRALFTVGRYDEARPVFATALQQTPNDWRAHMLMGMTLERQGNAAGAFEEYQTAAHLAPKAAQPHFNMASILGGQGKHEEAVAEYRKTLRLEPRHAEAKRALDVLAPMQP
jgi:protein O-mannosyl-transferase